MSIDGNKTTYTRKANHTTEAAVMNVVKQWFEAFTKGDMAGVLAFIAPDPDVVVIGTGENDKCIGLSELETAAERAFAETKGASVEIGWHSVSATGSLAWVAADVTFRGRTSEREIYFPLRYTAVLEKRGDRWLFVII